MIDKACYSAQHQREENFPMNVSLSPELDNFVAGKVESGRYNSASEVVREALRLLEEHDRVRGAQLAAFNQELGARLASLDRGERVKPETARARLEQKSRERRRLSA
jgi:antitoxin ParD1/3/4